MDVEKKRDAVKNIYTKRNQMVFYLIGWTNFIDSLSSCISTNYFIMNFNRIEALDQKWIEETLQRQPHFVVVFSIEAFVRAETVMRSIPQKDTFGSGNTRLSMVKGKAVFKWIQWKFEYLLIYNFIYKTDELGIPQTWTCYIYCKDIWKR